MNQSIDIETLKETIADIRMEFPILATKIGRRQLIYFDNAATSQTPVDVIDRLHDYYMTENANIHRGVHHLSQKATEAFEESRKKVQAFINAEHEHEVIFTSGTTDSINLVARAIVPLLNKGDEILISEMEHHSNIVPWQLIKEQCGISLKAIPMDDNGDLDLSACKKLLSSGKVKLLAVTHISNAIGTVNPIKEIIKLAHDAKAMVLIDGAQAVAHCSVDVQDLDADFYAFSGHKMFGPTGVGVLYGKTELLNKMAPYKGGGDMILEVQIESSTWNELPYKFEAGTPNIADIIALGAAIDFIDELGMETIENIETYLINYALKEMSKIEQIKLIGNPKKRAGAISFVMDDVHPHDIGTILDNQGIAIRAGHHCAQPAMRHFGVDATARISFAPYNTIQEVDKFILGFKKILEIFGDE